AHVHHQGAAQIGFFLELLDVELVGLGPDLPIEVADVVSRSVIAVLHELDRVPEEGTAVHAGDETFDHLASAQVQTRDAGDGIRMQKAARIVFLFNCHGVPFTMVSCQRPVVNKSYYCPLATYHWPLLSFRMQKSS